MQEKTAILKRIRPFKKNIERGPRRVLAVVIARKSRSITKVDFSKANMNGSEIRY